MAHASSATPANSDRFKPERAYVPAADCVGRWKLLVFESAEGKAGAVARGLVDAPGYDIAPGVRRTPEESFALGLEVEVEGKGGVKSRGVVWGAVMHNRKGAALLAIGAKDGTGVTLVATSKVKRVPDESRRLGSTWDSEAAYNAAWGTAGAAIDALVREMATVAANKQLAATKEPEHAHLTKPELDEEAHFHGYELTTPHDIEEFSSKVEEWKKIALSKEAELAQLKAAKRRSKKPPVEQCNAEETPRRDAGMKREREETPGTEIVEKKLNKLLKIAKKNTKTLKKVYKRTK